MLVYLPSTLVQYHVETYVDDVSFYIIFIYFVVSFHHLYYVIRHRESGVRIEEFSNLQVSIFYFSYFTITYF